MPEDAQSFFRRWRVVILLGVLVVVVLVVVREFVDDRSNSPIIDPYLAVINEMSLHSPRARQRLEHLNQAARQVLDQLAWWTAALKAAREKSFAPGGLVGANP